MQPITLKSSGYIKEDYLNQKDICVPYPSKVFNDVCVNFRKNKKQESLPQQAYQTLSDGSRYLIGKIYKKLSSQNLYEVQFTYTGIPRMKFEMQILLYLIDEYKKFIQKKQSLSNYSTPDIPISTSVQYSQEHVPLGSKTESSAHTKSPGWLTKETWEQLQRLHHGEGGEAPDSDDEYNDLDNKNDMDGIEMENELIHIHPRFSFDCNKDMHPQPQPETHNLDQAETVEGIQWEFGSDVPPQQILMIMVLLT